MRRLLMAAALVGALAACSTMQVKRDFDPNTDFATLKTFQIVPGVITGAYDRANEPMLLQRIENDLRDELTKKGLKEDPQNPDVLVTFVGGARDRTELETAYTGVYGGYGWGSPWGAGWGYPSATTYYTHTYTDGTLVVDLVDPKTKNLIYRGYASAEVPPEQLGSGKKVAQAIDKIFKDYPPKTAVGGSGSEGKK